MVDIWDVSGFWGGFDAKSILFAHRHMTLLQHYCCHFYLRGIIRTFMLINFFKSHPSSQIDHCTTMACPFWQWNQKSRWVNVTFAKSSIRLGVLEVNVLCISSFPQTEMFLFEFVCGTLQRTDAFTQFNQRRKRTCENGSCHCYCHHQPL